MDDKNIIPFQDDFPPPDVSLLPQRDIDPLAQGKPFGAEIINLSDHEIGGKNEKL